MIGFIFTIVIIVIVLLAILGSFFIVQQQNVYIIERFGRFARTADAGFRFKIPFIERIAKKVDLRTNQLTFDIDAKTQDNVTIGMQIAAQYHVSFYAGTTPMDSGICRSYYMLKNPVAQMQAYLTDALRSAVPAYTLDEVFDKKDSIASDVNETVAQMMRDYGYDLVSTLITAIQLPRDVEASMNKINSAQREKIAAQSLAEAERIKIVTEARASAEAMEQAGKGIAAQRKAIAEGISESLEVIKDSGVTAKEANELFLYTQWVDMMNAFAKEGGAATVVLPNDFKTTASMFEQMLVAGVSNEVTLEDGSTK